MIIEAHIYLGVALAGMVSFLGPCVLPLVPPYLGYLGGTTVGLLDNRAWLRVVLGAVLFVLGFTTVFVGLGAAASVFGQFIQSHRNTLSVLAGVVILLFGLHFLGLLRISILYKDVRYRSEVDVVRLGGAYLMGLAFAFGWTPCIGPVLATVLTLAANEGSLATGVKLLALYALGLGIPFILAAIAIGPFLAFLQRFGRHLAIVEKLMGVVLIITGVLFLTGSIGWLGQWMIDTFPALVTIEERWTPKSLPAEIMKKGIGS